MNNLHIQPILALKDNYIWAIIHQNSVLIIDPGDADPVLRFLKQKKLLPAGILITHHHWDHTNGIAQLKATYPNIPIYGPAKEKITAKTYGLQEGQQTNITNFPLFQAIDIPGHTLGHIAYHTDKILFCGDTLFAAGCGRIFEGTREQMFNSLQKIAALADDTQIYPAHEYTLHNLKFAHLIEPNNAAVKKRLVEVEALRKENKPTLPTTLALEKATNPFLRCDQPEIIDTVSKQAGYAITNVMDVFAYLREWKNRF